MSSGKQKKQRKGQKKKQKKSAVASPVDWLRDWFKDRHPILKFMLGFVAGMGLFYLFYYSSFYKNYLELPFLTFQANIGSFLLDLVGQNTTVHQANISGDNFSVNIKNGCDGLEAMAILVSGILIFPTTFRLKIPGLIGGILILLVLNFFRIAGLYLVGLNFSRSVFDILHIQGGFILFTMISVLLWFIWMNWATKRIKDSVDL